MLHRSDCVLLLEHRLSEPLVAVLSSQLSNTIVTPSFLIPLRVARIQWLFARAQATCSSLLPCQFHRSVRSLTSVVSYLKISWASSRVFSANRSRDAESCFSIYPQEQKRVPTLLVRPLAFSETVTLLNVTQEIVDVVACAVLEICVWRNLVP